MNRLSLFAICLLLLVSALPAFAVDRSEEVRATEVAFAKAFADRDAKKFFAYIADDAQFLGKRNTMRGKQEVIASWSEFFKPAVAPFRWEPERVVSAGRPWILQRSCLRRSGGADRHLYVHMDKTIGRLVENPLRRRLRVSDDEVIDAVPVCRLSNGRETF